METSRKLAQQYLQTCANYWQLRQLWEDAFRMTEAEDRATKLQEYQTAMEALDHKLLLIEKQFHISLSGRIRRPGASSAR